MKYLMWLLNAAIFFVLFAFALNNQHPASVKWFFGVEWQAPMVFIVLAAFALGCATGVLAMVPALKERGGAFQSWLLEYFVPSAGTQVQDYLSEFSRQTTNLTLIGGVVLIITAVLLLRTIDISLNGAPRLLSRSFQRQTPPLPSSGRCCRRTCHSLSSGSRQIAASGPGRA